MMKKSASISLALFSGWILLSILQLWGNVFDLETYWKLTVSMGLILIGVVAGGLIYREYIEEQKMKQDGYLDS